MSRDIATSAGDDSVSQVRTDHTVGTVPASIIAPDLNNLNHEQLEAVVEALKDSFTDDQFAMMLSQSLGIKLADLAEPGPWRVRVFKVVEESQRQGFGRQLIEAVEAERPNAERIKRLRARLAQLQMPSQDTDTRIRARELRRKPLLLMSLVVIAALIIAGFVYYLIPAPTVKPQWLAFTHPDIVAPDGNGYAVGYVSELKFQLLNDPSQGIHEVPFRFSYAYYNGSGTWRGDQTIFVRLLDASETAVVTLKFGLDRGKCVYGKAEPRDVEGKTPKIDAGSVIAISVQANAVSGKQTGC